MGNSCVNGKSDPGRNMRSNEKNIFKWNIDGFSSLLDKGEEWTCSRVFEIMGMKWFLQVNPRDRMSSDEQEFVSLRLELSRRSVKSDIIVEASFNFLVYDQSYGKNIKHRVTHKFQTASTRSGLSCMMPLEKLKKKSSDFLVNNSCVFVVEFTKVVTRRANTTLETLFVQKMNTFNEAETYTWDIEDFFALKKPGYSPEFEVGGYKWSIVMRPSCGGSHLKLYLKMKNPNDLPKRTAILVEFTLSIKDQEGGKHLKETGRFQFSRISYEAGCPKFISLEDFMYASKGYLIKSKCCIEAEVAVIGSSKTKRSR